MQNIHLSIPMPCHENWNNMTPSEQGRFCNACAKQVVDFSSMSDKEVLNYFSTVKDKEVCGRAFPQQLERTIQFIPEKPKPFYYRYFNYAALLLLFFKAGTAKAQGKVAVRPVQNKPVKHKLTERKSPFIKQVPVPQITMGAMIYMPEIGPINKEKSHTYTGYVADENNLPLPAATIIIEATGEAITADSTGRFVLKNVGAGEKITVSFVGYDDTTVNVKETGQTISLTKNAIVLKEVVISSSSELIGKMVRSGGMYLVSNCHRVKDSVVKRIINFNPSVSIYPNPVVKGNMLHVAVNFKKEEQYMLQIYDAAGRPVFQQSIQATAKNYLKELVAERSWGSGMFIIKIADASNKVVKTERFIAL